MTAAAPAHPRRFGGAPAPVAVAIAGAWALAIAAHATGGAAFMHHDALIESSSLWLGLALSLLAWQAMAAAMMLPSSLPLIRLFAHASASQPRPQAAMAGFLGGYAVVWACVGGLAFLMDAGVHATIRSTPWLHAHEWVLGGGVLALAGAFQFSSLKEACLRQCRHPAAFLLRHYARGVRGGFRLGARHSAFCVGCCWALMLVMFAVGVANLIWMALLTAVMVHEKTRPLGARSVPVTGVALLAAASIMLLYSAYAERMLS
jgi:predicted metal-binding membrane protein